MGNKFCIKDEYGNIVQSGNREYSGDSFSLENNSKYTMYIEDGCSPDFITVLYVDGVECKQRTSNKGRVCFSFKTGINSNIEVHVYKKGDVEVCE